MITPHQCSIVRNVESGIVQSVVGRERIETNGCISASTHTTEDINRWEDTGPVSTIFDLLIISNKELVGNPVLEIGSQLNHRRTGIVLDDITSVLSGYGQRIVLPVTITRRISRIGIRDGYIRLRVMMRITNRQLVYIIDVPVDAAQQLAAV